MTAQTSFGPTGDHSGSYRIGTVSRITGVDTHTLRAWERRYGAIRPMRTDRGTRVYDDAQVHRIRLLKAAVDAGDPIRHVAPLDDAALRARVTFLSGFDDTERAGPVRVAVVGASLERSFVNDGDSGVVLVETAPSAATLRSNPGELDTVLVHLSDLGGTPVKAAQGLRERLPRATLAVLYEFAPQRVLGGLDRIGAALLRGPLGAAELRRAVRSAASAPLPAATAAEGIDGERWGALPAPPPRAYTDAQLERLRNLRSSLSCECPNHLAAIVEGLLAFERYAAACANETVADARLHTRLADGTGKARGLMESLLTEVIRHDGLSI
ncbi:MAG: MerR family transcriptional regulator [Myxococcota bacterium]